MLLDSRLRPEEPANPGARGEGEDQSPKREHGKLEVFPHGTGGQSGIAPTTQGDVDGRPVGARFYPGPASHALRIGLQAFSISGGANPELVRTGVELPQATGHSFEASSIVKANSQSVQNPQDGNGRNQHDPAQIQASNNRDGAQHSGSVVPSLACNKRLEFARRALIAGETYQRWMGAALAGDVCASDILQAFWAQLDDARDALLGGP
jgi:hypothetical protein